MNVWKATLISPEYEDKDTFIGVFESKEKAMEFCELETEEGIEIVWENSEKNSYKGQDKEYLNKKDYDYFYIEKVIVK